MSKQQDGSFRSPLVDGDGTHPNAIRPNVTRPNMTPGGRSHTTSRWLPARLCGGTMQGLCQRKTILAPERLSLVPPTTCESDGASHGGNALRECQCASASRRALRQLTSAIVGEGVRGRTFSFSTPVSNASGPSGRPPLLTPRRPNDSRSEHSECVLARRQPASVGSPSQPAKTAGRTPRLCRHLISHVPLLAQDFSLPGRSTGHQVTCLS